MSSKRSVSFSFDTDNLDIIADSYNYKISDDSVLRRFYHSAGQRLLELLSEFDIKASFFVIGRDLEMSDARDFFTYSHSLGHELGNHTQNHLELSELTPQKQKDELILCHRNIIKYIGVEPKGFRGGSMQVTSAILEQMRDLGYEYDSSSYPTFLNFFLMCYLCLITFSTRHIPRWRHFASGFQPKEPFIAQHGPGASLVHLPTTVVPFLQLPFYATFHLLIPKLFDLTYPIVSKYRKNIIYQGHILDFIDPQTDEIPNPSSYENQL